MPIEFRCGQCNQLLRVPDDSAGKHARCPKCQALMTVPAASSVGGSEYFAPQSAGGGSGFPPTRSTPSPLTNPYGDAASTNPFGETRLPNLNPYAPPSAAAMHPAASPYPSLPINPQV